MADSLSDSLKDRKVISQCVCAHLDESMRKINKATTEITETASELYRYDSKEEIEHSRKMLNNPALLNKQMMILLSRAD